MGYNTVQLQLKHSNSDVRIYYFRSNVDGSCYHDCLFNNVAVQSGSKFRRYWVHEDFPASLTLHGSVGVCSTVGMQRRVLYTEQCHVYVHRCDELMLNSERQHNAGAVLSEDIFVRWSRGESNIRSDQ